VSALGTAAPGGRFPVLVVCTGNVCRSPAAELLLRAGLAGDPAVEVSSAGLDALAGAPVDEPVARLLRDRGVDPEGFRARQLSPSDVRQAGLVLTMTAAQRRAVVTAVPAAVRRTFTVLEFAGLAELADLDGRAGAPAERIAAVLDAVPRLRAVRPPAEDPAEDDVPDPYGRPDDVVAEVVATLTDAVERLLRVVGRSTVGEPR
jgi:protein-tyrosine phosphatase